MKGTKSLELLISVTLRIGILSSVSLGVFGAFLYLPTSGLSPVGFSSFAGSHVPYASLSRVFHSVFYAPGLAERGTALADVGIILLMLTPMSRVLFSLVSFARERDLLFTVITTVVLIALGFSVLIH